MGPTPVSSLENLGFYGLAVVLDQDASNHGPVGDLRRALSNRPRLGLSITPGSLGNATAACVRKSHA
jgi:hypothetical protein